MRATVLAFVAVFALLALPAAGHAAPPAPRGLAVAAPAITMVRGGCGPGWHRRHWRDRWGRWHVGRCVPNRH